MDNHAEQRNDRRAIRRRPAAHVVPVVRHPQEALVDGRGIEMTDWHDRTLADYLADAEDAYGLPERSGGHTWTEGTQGRVCTHCGQRWAEVVGATDEAIQQPHYAHDGLGEWEQKMPDLFETMHRTNA